MGKRLVVLLVLTLVLAVSTACREVDFVIDCDLVSGATARACWEANTGPADSGGADIDAADIRENWEAMGWTRVTGQVDSSSLGYVSDGIRIIVNVFVDQGCINVVQEGAEVNGVAIIRTLIDSDELCGLFSVANGPDDDPLVLVDTEINLFADNYDSTAIGDSNYTCLRCDIEGGRKAANTRHNVTIKDSFLHSPSVDAPSEPCNHGNMLFAIDAEDIVVSGSYVTVQGGPPGSENCLSNVVAIYGDTYNHTLDGNFLEGNSSIKIIEPSGNNLNLDIVDNVFAPEVPGYGWFIMPAGWDCNDPTNYHEEGNSVLGSDNSTLIPYDLCV